MIKKILLMTVLVSMSACGGQGGSDFLRARMEMSALTNIANRPKPTKADYALTCQQISHQMNNLQARFNKLKREEDKKQQKSALVSDIVDTAITSAGIGMLSNQNSASGMNNVVRGTNIARSVAQNEINKDNGQNDVKHLAKAEAIAFRMNVLAQVQIKKGCK
ncbi:MAG: hypothetical protein OXN83_03510 [Oligoflexia bacterium]|nr:hypothetical protein [Oligoflexia bacterium]